MSLIKMKQLNMTQGWIIATEQCNRMCITVGVIAQLTDFLSFKLKLRCKTTLSNFAYQDIQELFAKQSRLEGM